MYIWSFSSKNIPPHFLVHYNKPPHVSAIAQEHAKGSLRERPLQMAGQEQAWSVRLCKAFLGAGLALLTTYTAFTLPFPEAMYSVLMVTLLSFSHPTPLFFLQWMRTAGLPLIQGNSKCLVSNRGNSAFWTPFSSTPEALGGIPIPFTFTEIAQARTLYKRRIKSSLFHGKFSLFLWYCLLCSLFPHSQWCCLSACHRLCCRGRCWLCSLSVASRNGCGPCSTGGGCRARRSHFGKNRCGHGCTLGDWRLAWEKKVSTKEGFYKVGWSGLCFYCIVTFRLLVLNLEKAPIWLSFFFFFFLGC